MFYYNANEEGAFRTSIKSDELVMECRKVFAEFFNCDPEEVAFGENTSSNNFKLAFAFARMFEPGDEVLITNIDHEGNRSPWRLLEQLGFVIKVVDIDPETVTLDFEDFKSKLSDKTKIFAVNWAANSCGTVTDVKRFIDEAHKKAAAEAHLQIEEATRRIREEKERAIREVRAEITDLSIAIAEKVMQDKISRDKSQEVIINKLLDEMSLKS